MRLRPSPKNASQGLNESPSEKEGKHVASTAPVFFTAGLNESPSEKEGKSRVPPGYRG